jgi:ABC-type molybdate transport system substrate-binding protein
MNSTPKPSQRPNKIVISTLLALTAFALAYAPIPGLEKTVVVVSGTELAEPLKQLETQFEQQHPNINLELQFQGSQDIVNNYIDDKNDFKPTVVIPASTEFLDELNQRWQTQNNSEAFYDTPTAIAKTFLVGIAWPERGNILFPNGRFSWDKIEQAMQAKNWGEIGGQNNWGSFDFLMTDPTRSNSGQLTLDLWAKSKIGNNNLNNPSVESLFQTVKQSVYLPPRSTDILLQEFITRGPNDADVATVYESIALERWQQSAINQRQPYQIYYLNPTIETVATAAIVRRNNNANTAKAAREFIDFITQPEQQKVFVQFGFRPVQNNLDLTSIPGSPWSQNIPGVEINPAVTIQQSPNNTEIREIQRLWQRATQ